MDSWRGSRATFKGCYAGLEDKLVWHFKLAADMVGEFVYDE